MYQWIEKEIDTSVRERGFQANIKTSILSNTRKSRFHESHQVEQEPPVNHSHYYLIEWHVSVSRLRTHGWEAQLYSDLKYVAKP